MTSSSLVRLTVCGLAAASLLLGACGGDDGAADPADTFTPADTQVDSDGQVEPDAVAAEDTTLPLDAPDDTAEPTDTAGPGDAEVDSGGEDGAVGDASDDAEVTDPAALEALCWETSGAWEGGECDCQQDGFTTNLGFWFHESLGCVPDPELICVSTGGTWLGGAGCECPAAGQIPQGFDPRAGCRPEPRPLCEATGGVWEDDVCECQTDEADKALNRAFDPDLGCLAAPDRLCEATGGVWEEEDCACAQDGVSLHYEFDRVAGCGPPDDADLVTALTSLTLLGMIDATFHEDHAVWVIDRPGAIDAVHRVESLTELQQVMNPLGWGPISEQAGTCQEPFHQDGLPPVNCESDDGITPEGCYLVANAGDYQRVSQLMEALNDLQFTSYSEAEIAMARYDESMVLRITLSSAHAVVLAFRRAHGEWILTVVDLSRYSCSA